MNRDPFYREIIKGLNDTLDPELFEQCAADLLRKDWPGLTPIRGGTDAGMDGAIPDGRGEPFPLITTTSEDVIGNLTRNLRSYLREGGRRRRVVLAMSRSLTSRRQGNLLARAQELGFELISIQDQAAFANLLYRDPPWCQELLNLPSTPPALSKLPRTQRPFVDVPLIGRQASLDWLRQTTSDGLLLGQPGAGKTFLLHQMAQENRGLFLVSREIGDIAAGIRSQEPSIIFVDDAALDRDLLLTLRHMRTEMAVDFAIVATGWPGDEAALVQTLNLPNHSIHRLEPLTRGEIVQVINAVGVRHPNYLVREIVDQAEGRPGLAVTLALLWLQGGRREVVLGDTLLDSVVNFAERFIGTEAAQILAVLAVSGDAGLTLSTVAQLTDLREFEVHRVLNQLTASGVLMDVGEQRLTVRPPALRYALVRNVFFQRVPLDIAPILARVPRRSEAALVLIEARERGAVISDQLLRPLVIESPSTEVWEAYAGLGREEAEWALRDYPDMLAVIAEPGLVNAPATFLPVLLTAAVGDRRPLHQFPDHPLRRIEHWIESALPGRGHAFHRRRLLLEATEAWLRNNGEWRVGGHALQLVLSPSFHYVAADPVYGHHVEFTSGVLFPDELSQIQSFWPRVLNLISGIHVTDWSIVHQIIEEWIYGRRVRRDLPGEVRDVMNTFAVQMLREVIPLARQHPATLHWASGAVRRLGAGIPIELDPDFEILYPSRQDEQDFNEAEEREHRAVSALAESWSSEAPEQIARKIAQIELEANSSKLSSRWPPVFCSEIAVQVASRVVWARAFINANLSSTLIRPFLQYAVEANEEGWKAIVLECLGLPEMRNVATDLVLTLPRPPDELFELALQQLDDSVGYVKWACARGKIPEHHLRLLLRHPNAAIASAAAEGEWDADPQGTVRETLRKDWEEAVVRSSSDYWLSEVFREIPDLAYPWLQNHLAEKEFDVFDPVYQEVIQSAISTLTFDKRVDLLDQIPDHYGFGTLVINLVSGYPDLYKKLLQNERLQRYHGAPLAGVLDDEWFEKAILACDAGYSTEDIAHKAVYGHSGVMTSGGPWSAHWSKWVERFERLRSHRDERIQRIGETGRSWAIRERDDAQIRERREAVYGR